MDNNSGRIDYQNLFNTCLKYSDNLFILLSNDLTIQVINSAAEKILGWKQQDVCNKRINDVFEDMLTQPFIDMNTPTKKSQKMTYIQNKDHNLKIIWDIVPINDEEKKCESIFIIGKSEAALSDKELRLQLENVVKYAPGLFYWKDKNSVYQGCNDEFARLAGLESWVQVKGKTDFDLAWKDRAELYVDVDQRVIKSGKAKLNHEEVITISNNKTIVAITNKVPLLDNENHVIGLMGITTDITHQKKVEHDLSIAKEQAEIANNVKSEFIANMSHDIRTPLSGVVGMSQLLQESSDDPTDRQYAQWIHECGEQLLGLLNGILDVVSAENVSEKDIHLETFDLRQCVQDIVQLERPSTQLKGIALKVEVDEDIPPYIVSDRTKLHRILLNLLGNAIKFTKIGSVGIDIKLLERRDEWVLLQFRVVDTGIGIPVEFQDKVFDRFFRASPSYKGVYEGHGVGLHIAESYVDLLGGKIKLMSEPGVGTTFYFDMTFIVGKAHDVKIVSHDVVASIPISLEQPSEKFIVASSTMNDRPIVETFSEVPEMIDDAFCILLVEDNPIALKIMENLVSQIGFRYVSCIDGESALAFVKRESVELVITDIGLPGISGNELAQQVRAWEASRSNFPISIIGLTAHAQGQIREECFQSGINEVFTKPMNLSTLQSIKKNYILPILMNKIEVKGSSSPLGLDLPNTEQELFELNQFPVLDIEHVLPALNYDKTLLLDVLQELSHGEIPRDMVTLKAAHAQNDWVAIEKLAHKMKGGAVYCGTIKMQFACQYLERYRKAGHITMLEKLYQQLIHVCQETALAIEKWLAQNKIG